MPCCIKSNAYNRGIKPNVIRTYHEFMDYFGPIIYRRYTNFMTSARLEHVQHLFPYMYVNFRYSESPKIESTQKEERVTRVKKITKEVKSEVTQYQADVLIQRRKELNRRGKCIEIKEEYVQKIMEDTKIIKEVTKNIEFTDKVDEIITTTEVEVSGISFEEIPPIIEPNTSVLNSDSDHSNKIEKLERNVEFQSKIIDELEEKMSALTTELKNRDFTIDTSSKAMLSMRVQIAHLDRAIRFFKLKLQILIAKYKIPKPDAMDKMIHDKINAMITEENQSDPYDEL